MTVDVGPRRYKVWIGRVYLLAVIIGVVTVVLGWFIK
jgi:hypothetical protein